MVRSVKINGEIAIATRTNRALRALGWTLLVAGLFWLGINLAATPAVTLDTAAFPVLLVALSTLTLRESADEHLHFDRAMGTLVRSSQFRTHAHDLSRVQWLIVKNPSMRDWLRRKWRGDPQAHWRLRSGQLPSDDLRLLLLIGQVFDSALLAWWLRETLDVGLVVG